MYYIVVFRVFRIFKVLIYTRVTDNKTLTSIKILIVMINYNKNYL